MQNQNGDNATTVTYGQFLILHWIDKGYIADLIYKINDIGKRKKVKIFFDDYFLFLDKAYKVTKEYIIMTLGNRTVNGVNIVLVDFTKNYLKDYGMTVTYEGKRNIKNLFKTYSNSVQFI